MAITLYSAVDEGYSVNRIAGMAKLVAFCAGYTTVDGRKFTESVIKKELKEQHCIRLYDYDADELEEAQSEGGIRGKEWIYRVAVFK